MAKRFKVGDHVSWNSEAGRVTGRIIKVHTRNVRYKGYLHQGQSATTTNRDMNLIIGLCVPKEATKSFGLVQNDWKLVVLVPDGIAVVAEFVISSASR